MALRAVHIDLTEAKLCEVLKWVAQIEWDRAWLRSALARTAEAAMDAGVDHDVLYGLVDRCGAVRSEVLTAARDQGLSVDEQAPACRRSLSGPGWNQGQSSIGVTRGSN